MTGITTHVLDVSRGRPVAGLAVRLERRDGAAASTGSDAGEWRPLAAAATDENGRIREWPETPEPTPGHYRLTFATGQHFADRGADAFYPEVSIVFRVTDAREHHHVPLLLSPFGYTTYRGS